MAQTVIGIFDNNEQAQNAVEKLGSNGFSIDQVDLTINSRSVLNEDNSERDLSYDNSQTRTESYDSTQTRSASHEDDTFGEKVSRFFRNLFDDDNESEKYSRIAKNCAMVTVITDSRTEAERAAEILDDAGAVDVDERSRSFSHEQVGSGQYATGSATSGVVSDRDNVDDSRYDITSQDSTSNLRVSETDDADIKDRSFPIVEEEIQIGKREVDRGSVRIRSRIVEKPVEEIVRLREEHVRVDRTAVNRPATEGDLSTFREGEIEVKQRAEVPVVNKQARVVEEVRVNKDVTEREEVIRDTVRKTEVEVDETESDDLKSSRREKDDDLL